MTAPEAPRGVRIVHADGSTEPIEVKFVGQEPREVDGEILIFPVWEATTVLAWREGDRIEFDSRPDVCTIRTHRVGVR